MYYQILIETTEKVDESDANKQYFELDRSSLDDIEAQIVLPYLRKEEFLFSGRLLKFKEIKRILIKETQKSTYELSLHESSRVPHSTISVTAIDILNYKEHVKDITTTVFNKALSVVLAKKIRPTPIQSDVQSDSSQSNHPKVLLVHGRDHYAKDLVVKLLAKLGISTVITHEQIRGEKSIIEKVEENANIGFALVLYTPTGLEQKPRAHQNIAFEHGYLIAKLGRRKVSALVKGSTEVPNHINGVVYIPMDALDTWHLAIFHEMVRAGYNLDINQVSTTPII
jgi:predicted nucleotide-binding protein